MIELKIWNDETGTEEKGNYKFEVAMINSNSGKKEASISGEVKGFDRKKRKWTDLIREVLRFL